MQYITTMDHRVCKQRSGHRTLSQYSRNYSYAFKSFMTTAQKPWYLRFALMFCATKHKDCDFEPMHSQRTIYKSLFGKVYILQVFDLPPRTLNCRCVAIPQESS